MLISPAHLRKSAHLGCSSVKKVLILLAHLKQSAHLESSLLLIWIKSAHLVCSSEKKVLIFLAHLKESAHLDCSSSEKCSSRFAHLKKSAHLVCSSLLIWRWALVATVPRIKGPFLSTSNHPHPQWRQLLIFRWAQMSKRDEHFFSDEQSEMSSFR